MLIAYIILPLITLGFCVWATPIGRAAGVVDAPDGVRKTHKQPTPLVGGIAVLIPVAIMAAVLALTTDYSPFYLVLGLVVAAFLLLGFLDDQRHIRPALRLGLSIAVVLVALAVVPGFTVTFFKFSFLTSPLFLGGVGGALFTVLCVVGLQNAVNMADGKNGLVIGMSLIWVALLALYAPSHLQPLLAVFGAGLAITLAFNLRGKLFLGDSGSYGISAAIALIAIYTHNVAFVSFPADAVALMFLVPVADVLRLMGLRVLQRRSPFRSDRNHLHHVLLGFLPVRQALAAYLALAGAPSLLAYLSPGETILWAAATLTVYAVILGARYRAWATAPEITSA